jgi:Sap, sulfolipid-1-addressing protein
MLSVDLELALVGLAAMVEPATLVSSALVLTVGDRPLRTGSWFYVGGVGVTLCIGVIAAFVLGNAAASSPDTSTPKTWVAIVTLAAGAVLLGYVIRLLARRADPAQMAGTQERLRKVASAPALAIIAAGAVLANPGVFMLIAAKNISQLNPTRAQYLLDWTLFALVALLPLGVALVLLRVARRRTAPALAASRGWIERNSRTILAIVLLGLSAALLRDGIAGLTA